MVKIPSRNILVMISGYMQSGKDTVGGYLCNKYGFQRFAFADILKDEVAHTFSLDRNSLDCQKAKASTVKLDNGENKTIREILIDHGMMRRAQDADYWIKKVHLKISQSMCKRAVVTDWRFPNEWSMLNEKLTNDGYDVHTWRIQRWNEPPLVNITETTLDTFSFSHVIDNGSDILALTELVDKIIFRSGYLPLFLTDIDDVLVKWFHHFRRYIEEKGYTFTTKYPNSWNLSGWLLGEDGKPVVESEIKQLVLQFNHSEVFEHLEAYEGASEALSEAKRLGYVVVGISSCTDNKDAAVRRHNNMEKNFGKDAFHKIICLPLGGSKTEILKQFAPSIWIDDNIVNVRVGAACGHKSFLMNRPWNFETPLDGGIQRIESWEKVVELLKSETREK